MAKRLAAAEKEVGDPATPAAPEPGWPPRFAHPFGLRQVLVEVVRFTQKNGLRGCDGGWKDFLARNGRKFGASLSDPRKRTRDVLLAFLQTFSKDLQKVGYSFVFFFTLQFSMPGFTGSCCSL